MSTRTSHGKSIFRIDGEEDLARTVPPADVLQQMFTIDELIAVLPNRTVAQARGSDSPKCSEASGTVPEDSSESVRSSLVFWSRVKEETSLLPACSYEKAAFH